jgi:Dolichyl-phosphate-mannose-protein mannosyltransferase
VRTATTRLLSRLARDRVLLALALLLAAGLTLRVWLMLVWRPALTGYSDSGIYFTGAVRSLWSDPIRTVGYSMFLRVLHAIWPHLMLVTIVQHLLGLVAATLVFATVRRCGGPRWLGLVPAAIVALGGDELLLEHAALSDSLFIFLLIAALYCAVRAAPISTEAAGSLRWAAAAGLCVGLGAWDRGAGIVMAAVVPLWLLMSLGRPTWLTIATGALALAVVVTTLGVYVGWRKAASDMPGLLTSNNAYNLYARVAPWADCSKFTPPAGTRALCESTPPARRDVPLGEIYVYSSASPAYKLFGPAYFVSEKPHAMALLTSFSEAAILGEPLEYLHAVSLDALRLLDSGRHSDGDLSADEMTSILFSGPFHNGTNGLVEYWQPRLYPHEARAHHGDAGALKEWERITRIEGPWVGNWRPWMGILLALCLAGPWLLGARARTLAGASLARARAGMMLFGLTALAMLFFPILVKGYDYRFVIPAFAPLLAAGTLSAWGVALRLRAPRAGRARAGGHLSPERTRLRDVAPGVEPIP